MPRLDETQQVFWRLISAPEGVAEALRTLAERALPQGLEGLVHGDERLGAVERLDVYANMYFFRLLECLTEDFPALHAVIGHEAFHRLAADYLAAHPSQHPSVRMLGAHLGEFLEGHALTRARFWLPDLARFEWALLEAFDAADAVPIPAERLAELRPEDWADLRLTLTPSLRIVEAGAPIDEAWSAATSEAEIPPLERRPTPLRVWREELRVFHRRLEPVEVAALAAVACGRAFAGVCEAAAEIVGPDAAAIEVVRMLRRWIDDGMIVGLDISPCD